MSHFADRFTVLIDACCLAGALRRNMLLSLAEAGFYRARWSEMRLRFQRPEYTWDALCQKIEAQGLSQSASMMQEFSDLFK